jgi:hypothetical protein
MSWQSCYSTPLEFQAYIVKGYLENFGVPCILDSDRFGMKPLTFGALGEVRVLVRDDWAQVAAGLLRSRAGHPQRRRRGPWRLLRGGKR